MCRHGRLIEVELVVVVLDNVVYFIKKFMLALKKMKKKGKKHTWGAQDRSRAPIRCQWWWFVAVMATWHAHRGPNDGMNRHLGVFLAVGCRLALTWLTHRGVAGGGGLRWPWHSLFNSKFMLVRKKKKKKTYMGGLRPVPRPCSLSMVAIYGHCGDVTLIAHISRPKRRYELSFGRFFFVL